MWPSTAFVPKAKSAAPQMRTRLLLALAHRDDLMYIAAQQPKCLYFTGIAYLEAQEVDDCSVYVLDGQLDLQLDLRNSHARRLAACERDAIGQQLHVADLMRQNQDQSGIHGLRFFATEPLMRVEQGFIKGIGIRESGLRVGAALAGDAWGGGLFHAETSLLACGWATQAPFIWLTAKPKLRPTPCPRAAK